MNWYRKIVTRFLQMVRFLRRCIIAIFYISSVLIIALITWICIGKIEWRYNGFLKKVISKSFPGYTIQVSNIGTGGAIFNRSFAISIILDNVKIVDEVTNIVNVAADYVVLDFMIFDIIRMRVNPILRFINNGNVAIDVLSALKHFKNEETNLNDVSQYIGWSLKYIWNSSLYGKNNSLIINNTTVNFVRDDTLVGSININNQRTITNTASQKEYLPISQSVLLSISTNEVSKSNVNVTCEKVKNRKLLCHIDASKIPIDDIMSIVPQAWPLGLKIVSYCDAKFAILIDLDSFNILGGSYAIVDKKLKLNILNTRHPIIVSNFVLEGNIAQNFSKIFVAKSSANTDTLGTLSIRDSVINVSSMDGKIVPNGTLNISAYGAKYEKISDFLDDINTPELINTKKWIKTHIRSGNDVSSEMMLKFDTMGKVTFDYDIKLNGSDFIMQFQELDEDLVTSRLSFSSDIKPGSAIFRFQNASLGSIDITNATVNVSHPYHYSSNGSGLKNKSLAIKITSPRLLSNDRTDRSIFKKYIDKFGFDKMIVSGSAILNLTFDENYDLPIRSGVGIDANISLSNVNNSHLITLKKPINLSFLKNNHDSAIRVNIDFNDAIITGYAGSLIKSQDEILKLSGSGQMSGGDNGFTFGLDKFFIDCGNGYGIAGRADFRQHHALRDYKASLYVDKFYTENNDFQMHLIKGLGNNYNFNASGKRIDLRHFLDIANVQRNEMKKINTLSQVVSFIKSMKLDSSIKFDKVVLQRDYRMQNIDAKLKIEDGFIDNLDLKSYIYDPEKKDNLIPVNFSSHKVQNDIQIDISMPDISFFNGILNSNHILYGLHGGNINAHAIQYKNRNISLTLDGNKMTYNRFSSNNLEQGNLDIYYKAFQLSFYYDDALMILKIDDALFSSTLYNGVLAGSLDIKTGQFDIVGKSSSKIDNIPITRLPIIGNILNIGANKFEKGIAGFSFRVNGYYYDDDYHVTIQPLRGVLVIVLAGIGSVIAGGGFWWWIPAIF